MSQESLREALKAVEGKKRKYILLRIVGLEAEPARQLCQIPKGTYNAWFHQESFVEVNRKVRDWSAEYKQEAIQLLRRTTQLQAALLEEQIIEKMKVEIESGEYNLIRTLLARSVYDKIINSLDYQPESISMSWEQKLQQIYTNQPQIEGGVIDGEIIEAVSVQSPEHQKSIPQSVSEQESESASKEV